MRSVVEPCPLVEPGQQTLPVAFELIRRLRGARVRFGVYKNRGSVAAALAGQADLDLLVAAEDLDDFRAVLLELNAVRGLPNLFYDNATEGREDWFVPDFSRADYLHLDVAAGLRIGHKFRKRHLAFSYEDVSSWDEFEPAVPLPVVSPQDEARIEVLRSVFRLPRALGRRWLPLGRHSSSLLQRALPSDEPSFTLTYRLGSEEIACGFRNIAGEMEIEAAAARRLRQAVRAANGHSVLSEPMDRLLHQLRRLTYSAVRRLTALSPAMKANKRSPAQSGMVVALVGPDGVGKSTQVAEMARIFRKKFRCATVYLGSGDGGLTLRQKARRLYRQWRDRRREAALWKATRASRSYSVGSALWALVTAVERYITLLSAKRLAASGAIVISDRWPQNLRPGLLDGPRSSAQRASRDMVLLRDVERRLYRAMEKHKADLTIHLVSDFETSRSRKPGDIRRRDFERRLSLMREMRRRDPEIRVVDARLPLDEVRRQLFGCVWLELWRRMAPMTQQDAQQFDAVLSVSCPALNDEHAPSARCPGAAWLQQPNQQKAL